MYNKNFMSKGFTLIEIIVVISIISIITSITLIQVKSYKDLKNQIEVKRFNSDVISFINESRIQCILKESSRQISFLKGSDEVKVYESSHLKGRLKLPSGFAIKDNNVITSDKLIYINSSGMITTPCSLKYSDRKGKSNIITIGVGTTYAEIKE
ncbi:prepilin-type N-terminal cleavage/methylation domain-containing protein [Clostridium pasteurianum DSM 525 = ATCC 6013]|uniref:Prepilin-type N-terminal cleavage/methylation domain-containing protein n=1 Tax=Clostridium pasteurianum DSM 525 = ATCC 6013 TaxID=1262449 RepID=A0A0H3J4P3_CLOPA|nr:prepilin-type N-terminal cleavage/methylation domain-containing protein [Clostridium pasteurianum]AJA47952.1 prepilin-type N-terminal cleavage/methylation domain-containing protein [Clostridium pasteurianum DSM 525 = ATCC 6013]AJA51940.1 prepilin-type N-terminal cleavage/methylation domain-containing protein [Clostridium pasteurianum DSM 525 = ATCC 6013]AOZ75239.1 N-terminal cleavage protein [Clostridium pasteurianum DSM 525 = ATCC 6013]AOZ79034.1 N-terminal cleavage protein [Clostridium pas